MILVTGASGQIGSELVPRLENVIASDIRNSEVVLDVRDINAIEEVIKKHGITEVYHMASLLSATGEKDPSAAWELNVGSLKNVLDLAVKYKLKVFWPSSIAAFGSTTPRQNTPQKTVLEPTTMYGVTKVAGELLCQYYFLKYGVDVRSLRYPGLISYKALPGGGTTDFAVDVFYQALKQGKYTCFVGPETTLPMMYMDDAINATLQLMKVDSARLTIHTSYNLAALSFSAKELAEKIANKIPLVVDYEPDFRQKIADSWPQSIDDSVAQTDWDWKPLVNLDQMVDIMLINLKKSLS